LERPKSSQLLRFRGNVNGGRGLEGRSRLKAVFSSDSMDYDRSRSRSAVVPVAMSGLRMAHVFRSPLGVYVRAAMRRKTKAD
jgi:hypothetical protein